LLNISIFFFIPCIAIPTLEAGNALIVDFLAIHPKGCLFTAGGTLLLFSNHKMDFFGFYIFANMPSGKSIFILLF
jgi:hypothetical protein